MSLQGISCRAAVGGSSSVSHNLTTDTWVSHPRAPALSRYLGNLISASLAAWPPARKPTYHYYWSLHGTGKGEAVFVELLGIRTIEKKQLPERTLHLYKGCVLQTLRLHAKAGRQNYHLNAGWLLGKVITEILYLKAGEGTSPQSSSSWLCHCPSEDSKVYGPLRTMNTSAAISIDQDVKRLSQMWLNSALGRKPQQRVEDKGNTVPCGDNFTGAEPQRMQRRTKEGKCGKAEVSLHPEYIFGGKEEAGQDQVCSVCHAE